MGAARRPSTLDFALHRVVSSGLHIGDPLTGPPSQRPQGPSTYMHSYITHLTTYSGGFRRSVSPTVIAPRLRYRSTSSFNPPARFHVRSAESTVGLHRNNDSLSRMSRTPTPRWPRLQLRYGYNTGFAGVRTSDLTNESRALRPLHHQRHYVRAWIRKTAERLWALCERVIKL